MNGVVIRVGVCAWIPLALVNAASPTPQTPLLSDDIHRLVPAGEEDLGAVFGDLDGDGDLDLVYGAHVALNDGSGAFRAASCAEPSTPIGRVMVARLADFDGDGDLDAFLAVSSVYGGPQEDDLWLNDGAGCFTSIGATLPPPNDTDLTTSAEVGDVDGDGDVDIVCGDWAWDPDKAADPGHVRLLLNDGSAHFSDASSQIAAPASDEEVATVAMGDVDGDQDLDLFVLDTLFFGSTYYPQHSRLLVNDGSGYFSDASSQFPVASLATYPAPALVRIFDADLDGRRDLLVGATKFFRNTGNGHFADSSSSLPSGGGVLGDVGDVDGDGDPDLVLTNAVWRNDGSGVFAPAPNSFPVLAGSVGARLCDVDGDSDLDALVLRSHANELAFNDGSGHFSLAPVAPLLPWSGANPSSIAFGDVDGDGRPDLLAGDNASDRLWLNRGNAEFSDASQQLPPLPDATSAVALADVDQDGDLDALFATPFGPERLATNDGQGHFSDAPGRFPNTSDNTGGLALADVDLDGDLDVLATNYFALDQLYFNDGSGHFASVPGAWPNGGYGSPNYTTDAAFGDLDGDGDPDVVLAVHGSTPGAAVFRNDGGTFVHLASVLSGIDSPAWSVALADVDGDGDLDVALAAYAVYFPTFEPGLHLYRNDGAWSFTEISSQLPAATQYGVGQVELVDLDGDGDRDLITANPMVFGSNDGSGHFADATSRVPSAPEVGGLVFADLDLDGDFDAAALATTSSPRLLINLTHQLAWRSLPVPGKPLHFDVWGEPNRPFTLFGSHAQTYLPLGPLGILQIVRSQLFFASGGALDASGHALVTWNVPNNPALIGTQRYWQVLLKSPRRLTNLEITTFVSP